MSRHYLLRGKGNLAEISQTGEGCHVNALDISARRANHGRKPGDDDGAALLENLRNLRINASPFFRVNRHPRLSDKIIKFRVSPVTFVVNAVA